MAEQAKITSLEALEYFRQRLIVFQSKAQQVLDEVRDEIKRTRNWLQLEQPRYWETEFRKRRIKLEHAESELMTARFSEFVDSPVTRQMAVRKAKEALAEAEMKLRKLKMWNSEFEGQVTPYLMKLERIRTWLTEDLIKANSFLHRAQTTLEDYADATTPMTAEPINQRPASPEEVAS